MFNNKKLEEGIITTKDKLAPAYINLKNPKYLEIDNIFYSGIIVIDYNREYSELILKNLLELNLNMNISIFYELQDQYKTIRELSYYIGTVSTDIKEIKEHRQDVDIASFTYGDAKYIRKEMQVNNEDLYLLYVYIEVFSEDLTELEIWLNKVEGVCNGNGLQTRRANFRQEQLFLSTGPFFANNQDIKNAAKRNVLSNSLISTYPFISSGLFDEEGIFLGTDLFNNSMIFINTFDLEKYKNANMCIFGTSGAGKSFFTKLFILRQSFFEVDQYIIDPEREYINLCKRLNGTLIKIGPKSNTYINIFDIREESAEENKGYLATKITKLIGFFSLIFEGINEEEKALLEEKIIETYKTKGITFEDESLYREQEINIKPVFKKYKDMPILEDLYVLLEKDIRLKNIKNKLIPFVKGSMQFFNKYTNVELNNKIIIADIYDLGEENIKYGMYLFTDFFWDKIKKNRTYKKVIYFDEVWRLIGITSNKNVAGFIYKIFKTIRKYGGSSIAITQDVSDLFSLEDGSYGKSIINNSSIKTIFSLEEENLKILEQYIKISEKEKYEINKLKRGDALLMTNENHVLLKIEASDLEKEIIN